MDKFGEKTTGQSVLEFAQDNYEIFKFACYPFPTITRKDIDNYGYDFKNKKSLQIFQWEARKMLI